MNRGACTNPVRAAVLLGLGGLFGVAGTLLGAALTKGLGPQEVVAKVAGKTITVEALQKHMVKRSGGDARAVSTLDQKKALLEELVRVEALAAKARLAGYEKDPEIAEALDRLLARKLRREQLEPKLEALEVGDEEVLAFYEANAKEFRKPAQAEAAMLFFKVSATADAARKAEVEKRAREALAAAKKLAATERGFGAVAVKYSEDQATRYQRGEMGPVTEGREDYRWDKAVTAAVLALVQPGEISPLIRTPEGIYLVRLIEKKAAGRKPLQEVRDRLQARLLRDKERKVTEAYYEGVKKELGVELDETVLGAVEVPGRSPKEDREIGPPPVPEG